MRFIVSENWKTIFNSEIFAKAEIVHDATTTDKDGKIMYALNAWVKDGSVYRFGTYETFEEAKSKLVWIILMLTGDERDLIISSQEGPEVLR